MPTDTETTVPTNEIIQPKQPKVQPPLASEPSVPTHRFLRGYAFDPSMTTQLETALVSEIMYKVPWEENLRPGPIGEYVEVVDYDPASNCFYAPVDLNNERILAQRGLAPSEGNPQFHQQMVYAVAMTTIDRFERALGRKAFWIDPYQSIDPNDPQDTQPGSQFVQCLRIYPHALRMANAYYSRDKQALLFGYFPGTEDRTSGQFPGGMVFTCLSHDVIAHETTHALVDGFHKYFMEATNPDVRAFHEAFADIVALFQHFSFPEVISHQIAKTRGDLNTENLLAQLAAQFGHARGVHGALRDAIGKYDQASKKWVRQEPDPTQLERTMEVHGRGAVLVAAVFDAFLLIYQSRSGDLFRLATGGTGVLPQGALHPDLVNRLAKEAAKAASHVLNMCFRALDYCPPVDLTFGDYLRALITADLDLVPYDPHRYRVAFIEAFRRHGIYPQDVRTLSEDSLRWPRPGEDPTLDRKEIEDRLRFFIREIKLRDEIHKLRYLETRKSIWEVTRGIRRRLHWAISTQEIKAQILSRLTGLALTADQTVPGLKVHPDGSPIFTVQTLREARREGGDGRVLNQVFITLLQKQSMTHKDKSLDVRCGSVLVLDLDEESITYVINKPLNDRRRLLRTIEFEESPTPLGLTYFGKTDEPFAELHLDAG